MSVGAASLPGGAGYTFTRGERSYRVAGRLVSREDRNCTEIVTEIDGNISKQRVLLAADSITLFTKEMKCRFEDLLCLVLKAN